MSVLPFEIGYVSAMSDAEMVALEDELQRIDFWRSEEHVQVLADRYMKHFWRGPGRLGGSQFPMQFSAPRSYVEESNGISVSGGRICNVRVPEFLAEKTARLLVEMQLREQLWGVYAPENG